MKNHKLLRLITFPYFNFTSLNLYVIIFIRLTYSILKMYFNVTPTS